MLIQPPDDSLANVLSEHLTRTPPFLSFHFAVAWARQRGVELIAEALEAYPGRSVGIVGLNGRRTSYEALYLLCERLEELWVFYKHPFQTFHPKMYFFLPDPNIEAQKAVIITGSSNLTVGGLATNFEACWLQELDPNDIKDKAALAQVQQYLTQFTESAFCHQVTSVDFLSELLEGGYIRLERSLRISTRRSMGRRPRPRREGALPEAPPPLIEGIPTITVPLPELEEPETIPRTVEISEELDEVLETLFYVRTLTENDVLKAHRQRSGTWEPDLGLTARNKHPKFWGWPDKYDPVPSSSRRAWHTKASFHSRILPEGTIQSVRLWFRPERPGHAAEHRFRPATRVKDLVIPPEFDTKSLMVVQRLPEGDGAVFRVDFILRDDPEYGDYARYLTNERPGHRFGYGLISDIEE